MSAQYVPLQGNPPPYNDIERGDSQAEPSNTGNDNECLKPGELARVVHYDPFVKVVPMRDGWESSTIKVKRSALPNASYPFAVLESWIVISYVLYCSNSRFLSSAEWVAVSFGGEYFSLMCSMVVMILILYVKHLFIPIIFSISVLCVTVLQLILTVVCYREEREYFGRALFALIAMVFYGSFTISVLFSHCYEAGEAALAAVAAAESGTADECSESHALSALPYSQPTGDTAQDPEQNVESSQSCPQPSQVTDLGTVQIVRHDPIIKVVPFGGNWESSYIIVRLSTLPLKLRCMAFLSLLSWCVIPIAITLALIGAAVSVPIPGIDLGGFMVAFLFGGAMIATYGIITFSVNWDLNGPVLLFNFVKCVICTTSLQLANTAVFYYVNRTYFFYNLSALVLLVLFGMVSIAVVYRYHYQAGKAALSALAAERARSSQPEDNDSHECGTASKMTSR